MNVIIPFHAGDREQAQRLITWIQELGPLPGQFWLLSQQEQQDPSMLPVGWKWITDYDGVVCNWKDKAGPDATGPNSVWRTAAREMRRLKAGPWLWLEPDAVPVHPRWLSRLIAEYEANGKPFMGGQAPSRDVRMSGVAIYAEQTPALVTIPFLCDPVAFDYAGAAQFIAAGVHYTKLIADQFRCATFVSQEDFDVRVPVEAVIHHGCKDDTIYRYARARVSSLDSFTRAEECSNFAPSRCDEVTALLNAETKRMGEKRFAQFLEREKEETFLVGTCARLDWIMERCKSWKHRAQFYAELRARGIEAGRKSSSPKKQKVAR